MVRREITFICPRGRPNRRTIASHGTVTIRCSCGCGYTYTIKIS